MRPPWSDRDPDRGSVPLRRPSALSPLAGPPNGARAGALAVVGLRRRRGAVDPFCALEVQLALTRVDAEIVALTTRDDDRFARGHHLTACRLAFDQLLDEACRLADVTDLPPPGPVRRMVAEAELRVRGWNW